MKTWTHSVLIREKLTVTTVLDKKCILYPEIFFLILYHTNLETIRKLRFLHHITQSTELF